MTQSLRKIASVIQHMRTVGFLTVLFLLSTHLGFCATNAQTISIPIIIPLNSQYLTQNIVPAVMKAGQKYRIAIVFRNTGAIAWNSFLCALKPQENVWSVSQVELKPKESILKNQIKIFDFQITAPLKAGTYNFQWQMAIKGRTFFGQKSKLVKIYVYENSPPQIQPIENTALFENQLLSVKINATDQNPADILSYSALNVPQGASFDAKAHLLTWKPAYGQKGTYQVQFVVSDGLASSTQTADITVKKTVIWGTIFEKNTSAEVHSSEGATVQILDLSKTKKYGEAATDATGHFDVFRDSWQDGTYYIKVSKSGYKTYYGIATLRNNSAMPFSITLERNVTLIGPEGGTVESSDTMVKLVIPPNALSAPVAIDLVAVDRNTIEVEGGNLLSIVECQPAGLEFLIPVALEYTLSDAEIPGTEVELAMYNSIANSILPTGQKSLVSADGYTVRFDIKKFGVQTTGVRTLAVETKTVFAALKIAQSSQAPIGSSVKIPVPDLLTGSFSHSMGITVPPGRKGIQPALGIVYRSSNPNSWVGMGMSLNPGYIVRSTRLGPPKYDDIEDTFYFVSDAGTTEMVHLIDNVYQAKIEAAFSKFYKESDDSWKVVSKDGGILRFGQNADAKERSDLGTYSWYLTKATDTNGNYVEYRYIKDEGKAYLNRIDYTGNEAGISPTNTVEFSLEPRTDVVSSYLSTAKITTSKRLREITAKVNADLVWRYELEYEYSLDTGRSLFKAVKQFASDGKALPEQRFEYQRAK